MLISEEYLLLKVPLRASTTNPLLQGGILADGDQAGSGNNETNLEVLRYSASVGEEFFQIRYLDVV
jgi:hypothetical protein